MEPTTQALISQQELASRWHRTTAAIGLASALGLGPKYRKVGGQLCYLLEDVQKYERDCRFGDPSDWYLHPLARATRQ